MGFIKLINCFSYRALRLSTEEYGAMWLAYSHDTKQNLTLIDDDQDPFAATLNVLKRTLQLHVVEIIGKAQSLLSMLQKRNTTQLMSSFVVNLNVIVML